MNINPLDVNLLEEKICIEDTKKFIYWLKAVPPKRATNFKTIVPSNVSGNVSSIARKMILIVLQSTLPLTRKPSCDDALLKRLDDELVKNCGYTKGAPHDVMNELRGKSFSIVDIVTSITAWAKEIPSDYGLDRTEAEQKVADLITLLSESLASSNAGFFKRRCNIIRQLLDYKECDISSDCVYQLICSNGGRLTVCMFNSEKGMGQASICKSTPSLDHLSDWIFELHENNRYGIVSKVVDLNLLGGRKSRLRLNKAISYNKMNDSFSWASLFRRPLPTIRETYDNLKKKNTIRKNMGDDWKIFKHKTEPRYAIINIGSDAPLTGNYKHPISLNLIIQEGVEVNDIGVWTIEKSKTSSIIGRYYDPPSFDWNANTPDRKIGLHR